MEIETHSYASIFGIGIEVFVILFVLAIPTFFFSRWALKKIIRNEKTRKITTWAATCTLTPLIYVGLIYLWIFSISYYPTHDFDKQRWLTDKEKRYELSGDIIKSKILIGKTKAEVREILGDEGNSDSSNHWNYDLGFRPGFLNIDPDVLDIEFKDGKVMRVGQHET